jgi:CRISPR-associated protein Cas2
VTRRYFVTYDIADPKRLRLVFRIMKGAGEHVQLSVFRCDLSERQVEELMSDLQQVIQAREDQVLIIDLGPTRGVSALQVRALGRAYDPRESWTASSRAFLVREDEAPLKQHVAPDVVGRVLLHSSSARTRPH